ncbi:MAG: putative DNA-binding domain-containing protein [Deltaproteobacteria bacterium]|nr:putative DNA-binding domain-containing protein [Deltaproteobacteria bacterium]
MSRSELPLAELQRWMVEVISHGPDVEHSLQRPVARELLRPDEVAALIKGPGPLGAVAGVGIYHRMYQLRLREALEIDFPALQAALGKERFLELANGYLEVHPSRSWTLNRLGDDWPAHLQKVAEPWIAELAQLELEQTLAIQSPASPRISPADLAQIPPDQFADAHLRPIPSLRLMVAEHDVLRLYLAYRDDQPLRPPAPERTRIAIYRGERTEQFGLLEAPFTMLQALAGGRSLGEAIEAAYPEPTEADAEELQASLADWTSRGLFAGVEL